MSEELPWTKRWWRDLVNRHGRRGLIIAAVLGVVATGVYQGLTSFVATQVEQALTGGDEVTTPVAVAVGEAPLVVTVVHKSFDCKEGVGGWLVPDEETAMTTGLTAISQKQAPGPFASRNVSLAVQGTSAKAVLLTGMRAVVDERRPVTGLLQQPFGQCGAGVPTRPFAVRIGPQSATVTALPGLIAVEDVSVPPPGARLMTDSIEPMYAVPAVDFPYQVSQADIEHFIVRVEKIDDCDCLWHLEIDWASNGLTGTFRIDNQGKPFRTTSARTIMCFEDPTGQTKCGEGLRQE